MSESGVEVVALAEEVAGTVLDAGAGAYLAPDAKGTGADALEPVSNALS